MSSPNNNSRRVEQRNIVSSIFVTILIGLAYQEVIPPVRDSIRAEGLTFETAALFTIFFLTSMRFFIGNQLHLLSPNMQRLPGIAWFFDFNVIVLQCVVFIFLAGLCSVQASQAAKYGFAELLILLYSLDIAWIISQWLVGRRWPASKRNSIPWPWAGLNTAIIALIMLYGVADRYLTDSAYLAAFLYLNTAGFIIDVILVDIYELI